MRVTSLLCLAMAATSVLAQGTINFYQIHSSDLAATADPSCVDCQSIFLCTMKTDNGFTLAHGNFGGAGQFKGVINETTQEVGAYFLGTDGSNGGVEFNLNTLTPLIGALNGSDYYIPTLPANWLKWGNWSNLVREEPALDVGLAAAKCLLSLGEPALNAAIALYPEVAQGSVSGNVAIRQANDVFRLTVRYDLAGLTPSATGGLHIHTGTSCAVAAEVGNHYWQPNPQVPDPWSAQDGTMWVSDAQGNAKGSFDVSPGFGLLLAQGHALVIHAPSGSRIGCGVLSMTANEDFQTAPFNGVFQRNPMSVAGTNLFCGSATKTTGKAAFPASQATASNGQFEYIYYGGCTDCCYKPNTDIADGQVETGSLTGNEWLVGAHPIWAGMWEAQTGPLADAEFCGFKVKGTQLGAIDYRDVISLGPVLRTFWCDLDMTTGKRYACYFESSVLAKTPVPQAQCNVFPAGQYNIAGLQSQASNLVQQNVDLFSYFSSMD